MLWLDYTGNNGNQQSLLSWWEICNQVRIASPHELPSLGIHRRPSHSSLCHQWQRGSQTVWNLFRIPWGTNRNEMGNDPNIRRAWPGYRQADKWPRNLRSLKGLCSLPEETLFFILNDIITSNVPSYYLHQISCQSSWIYLSQAQYRIPDKIHQWH